MDNTDNYSITTADTIRRRVMSQQENENIINATRVHITTLLTSSRRGYPLGYPWLLKYLKDILEISNEFTNHFLLLLEIINKINSIGFYGDDPNREDEIKWNHDLFNFIQGWSEEKYLTDNSFRLIKNQEKTSLKQRVQSFMQ